MFCFVLFCICCTVLTIERLKNQQQQQQQQENRTFLQTAKWEKLMADSLEHPTQSNRGNLKVVRNELMTQFMANATQHQRLQRGKD